MRRVVAMATGAAVLAVSLGVLLAGRGFAGAKQAFPEEEFARLVSQEAKVVQDLLVKGTLDAKNTRKVRAAAFMIAVYAQTMMTAEPARAKGLASLRDSALKVMKLAEDGKAREAAAEAKSLDLTAKAREAKTDPVALEKVLPIVDLMHVFSSVRIGGFGIEKELGDLEEADTLTAEQMERLGNLSYKLAMFSHAVERYTADKPDSGKTSKKAWLGLNEQFRKASLETAAAARSKNAAASKAALVRLNKSCLECHEVFRQPP